MTPPEFNRMQRLGYVLAMVTAVAGVLALLSLSAFVIVASWRFIFG